MKISMSLEPAQREVAEIGSDDGNRVKKTSGHAPAIRLVLLNLYIQSKLKPRREGFPGGAFLSSNDKQRRNSTQPFIDFFYIGLGDH